MVLPARRFAIWDHSTNPVSQLSELFCTLRNVDSQRVSPSWAWSRRSGVLRRFLFLAWWRIRQRTLLLTDNQAMALKTPAGGLW